MQEGERERERKGEGKKSHFIESQCNLIRINGTMKLN